MKKLIVFFVAGLVLSIATSCNKEKNKEKEAILVQELTLDPASALLTLGEPLTITATVNPPEATNKELQWISSAPDIATVENGLVKAVASGTAVITVRTTDGSELEETCNISVREHWVDLGLSVKWAICNVGAYKLGEYGDYFAWGEVEPKDDYSWSAYKWCKDGNVRGMTKYNVTASYGNVDDLSVLQLGEDAAETVDDAARFSLGSPGRMPTAKEFRALVDSCDRSWISLDNAEGIKFTSRKNPDKWIFLPAAGYKDGTSTLDAGTKGAYWSSSLDTTEPNLAYFLEMLKNSAYANPGFNQRRFGYTVRPVCDK